MRVVDERREVGRRGVKRDEQKRVSAALVMALYAVRVCVLCITNYFIKV